MVEGGLRDESDDEKENVTHRSEIDIGVVLFHSEQIYEHLVAVFLLGKLNLAAQQNS